MSDAMTSECECPRCGRPVKVEWRWALALKQEVAPESREAVDDGTCELTIPRYARRAECPTCGARLVLDHELAPEFFARLCEEGVDDGDE